MSNRTVDKIDRSHDRLARAFLAMLVGAAREAAGDMFQADLPGDQVDTLIEQPSIEEPDTSGSPIRADVAAAAVLTARAIESEPGLMRDLRRGRPVVTIATHSPELVLPVRQVIECCAFGRGTHVQTGRIDSGDGRTALVIARDGSGGTDRFDRRNEAVVTALYRGCPIVGIACDPSLQLPPDLVRAADARLALGRLDAASVALVAEAITGRRPTGRIDPDMLSAVEVSDLQRAFRSRRPNECLRRLAEVVSEKRSRSEIGSPRLEELAGYGQARRWGLDLAADLAAYRAGTLAFADIDKGLLLAGPPGVGKTLFAQALARSAGLPLVATSVAEWNSADHLSGALQAMRAAFSRAKRLAPALLFIDEIDGITDRATLHGEHVAYWSQIVNQFLQLLSGVDERSDLDDRAGIIVVGATNWPDRIDAAVRRAGRLDRTIFIEKPGLADLTEMFRFHLRDALPGADLLPAALAARGGTGADVEAWVRRARGNARRARRAPTVDDLLAEIRGSRDPLPPGLRRQFALHEAGHVVVAASLGLFRLRAVGLHDTGGAANVELSVEHRQTPLGLESMIVVLLAGRAAECALYPPEEITLGAGADDESDLARATAIATDIELRYGCGSSGLFRPPDRLLELGMHDAEVATFVRARLDKCFDQASEIVAANARGLVALAGALEARGYLDAEEIEALLAPHGLPAESRLPPKDHPEAGGRHER